MTQTEAQSQEDRLIELVKGNTLDLDRLNDFVEIDDMKFAQIVLQFNKDLATAIVRRQLEMGLLNDFLLAFCYRGVPEAQRMLEQMYLYKRGGLSEMFRFQISPVVEIHPYIRSRMLTPQDVPSQLRQLIQAQAVHAAVFGDFENLFLQAVLADDYELARLLLGRCRFTRRHEQVRSYYLCATRQQKNYENGAQFNTFSSESGAKYGKVEQYVNPFSAVVEDNALAIHNETGEEIEVVLYKNKKLAAVLQVKLAALDARAVDARVPLKEAESYAKAIVKTKQQALLVNLPERRAVKMQRIAFDAVRFTDASNRPAIAYVENVVGGRVAQCGFSDFLGIFHYGGAGSLRVFAGDEEFDFQ